MVSFAEEDPKWRKAKANHARGDLGGTAYHQYEI